MSSKKTLQFPLPLYSGLGRYFNVTLGRGLLLKRKIIIINWESGEKVLFFKGVSSKAALRNSGIRNLE